MKKTEDTGKGFWSRFAWLYNRVISKDAAAYGQMYALMRPVVHGKTVLELATGTGLIAKNLVHDAAMIEATDFSPEMIAEAQKENHYSKLHFSVQDMFHLPYADGSFEVVIASNVLHIIPEPEKAIAEMERVLTTDGVLILPTFTHGEMGFFAHLKANLMKCFGFPLHHAWGPQEYHGFLEQNGLTVRKFTVLNRDAGVPARAA